MQRYVLGFAFDNQRSRVALIRKNRPKWQAGKLNGIGGKVESGETVFQAMRREFREETGADVPEEHWQHYGMVKGADFQVWCFATQAADLDSLRSETDEAVEVHGLSPMNWHGEAISNLPALIFNALDPDAPFITLAYRELADEARFAHDAASAPD